MPPLRVPVTAGSPTSAMMTIITKSPAVSPPSHLTVRPQSGDTGPVIKIVCFPELDTAIVPRAGQDSSGDVPADSPDTGAVLVKLPGLLDVKPAPSSSAVLPSLRDRLQCDHPQVFRGHSQDVVGPAWQGRKINITAQGLAPVLPMLGANAMSWTGSVMVANVSTSCQRLMFSRYSHILTFPPPP